MCVRMDWKLQSSNGCLHSFSKYYEALTMCHVALALHDEQSRHSASSHDVYLVDETTVNVDKYMIINCYKKKNIEAVFDWVAYLCHEMRS